MMMMMIIMMMMINESIRVSLKAVALVVDPSSAEACKNSVGACPNSPPPLPIHSWQQLPTPSQVNYAAAQSNMFLLGMLARGTAVDVTHGFLETS